LGKAEKNDDSVHTVWNSSEDRAENVGLRKKAKKGGKAKGTGERKNRFFAHATGGATGRPKEKQRGGSGRQEKEKDMNDSPQRKNEGTAQRQSKNKKGPIIKEEGSQGSQRALTKNCIIGRRAKTGAEEKLGEQPA